MFWQARGLTTVEQVIGQAELAPAVVSRMVWRVLFAPSTLIHWIDNEAARFGLLRGYSAMAVSSDLISWSQDLDMEVATASWIERVPSTGNPGDAPSRLRFNEYRKEDVVDVESVLAVFWRGVLEPAERARMLAAWAAE